MSIYYECRFKNIKLDLSKRSDIKLWLSKSKEMLNDTLSDNEYEIWDNYVPEEIKEYSRVDRFYNSFTDNLIFNINFLENDIVELNLCIGNKNKNNDIERLIWLLKPYIIFGKIYFYDEDITRQVNIDKSFKNGWHKDKFYDILEFYTIKESIKSLSIPIKVGENEIDYLYDELFNGLR